MTEDPIKYIPLDQLSVHQRQLEREVEESSRALMDFLGLSIVSTKVPLGLILQVIVTRLAHKIALLETQLEELRNEVRASKTEG